MRCLDDNTLPWCDVRIESASLVQGSDGRSCIVQLSNGTAAALVGADDAQSSDNAKPGTADRLAPQEGRLAFPPISPSALRTYLTFASNALNETSIADCVAATWESASELRLSFGCAEGYLNGLQPFEGLTIAAAGARFVDMAITTFEEGAANAAVSVDLGMSGAVEFAGPSTNEISGALLQLRLTPDGDVLVTDLPARLRAPLVTGLTSVELGRHTVRVCTDATSTQLTAPRPFNPPAAADEGTLLQWARISDCGAELHGVQQALVETRLVASGRGPAAVAARPLLHCGCHTVLANGSYEVQGLPATVTYGAETQTEGGAAPRGPVADAIGVLGSTEGTASGHAPSNLPADTSRTAGVSTLAQHTTATYSAPARAINLTVSHYVLGLPVQVSAGVLQSIRASSSTEPPTPAGESDFADTMAAMVLQHAGVASLGSRSLVYPMRSLPAAASWATAAEAAAAVAGGGGRGADEGAAPAEPSTPGWAMAMWVWVASAHEEASFAEAPGQRGPRNGFRALFFKGPGGSDQHRTPSVWMHADSNHLLLRVSTARLPGSEDAASAGAVDTNGAAAGFQELNYDVGTSTTQAVPARRWVHVAFSFQNLTAACAQARGGPCFEWATYIDGQLDRSLTVHWPYYAVANDGPLTFGRTDSFDGLPALLAGLQIVGRPLSPGAARRLGEARAWVFAPRSSLTAGAPQRPEWGGATERGAAERSSASDLALVGAVAAADTMAVLLAIGAVPWSAAETTATPSSLWQRGRQRLEALLRDAPGSRDGAGDSLLRCMQTMIEGADQQQYPGAQLSRAAPSPRCFSPLQHEVGSVLLRWFRLLPASSIRGQLHPTDTAGAAVSAGLWDAPGSVESHTAGFGQPCRVSVSALPTWLDACGQPSDIFAGQEGCTPPGSAAHAVEQIDALLAATAGASVRTGAASTADASHDEAAAVEPPDNDVLPDDAATALNWNASVAAPPDQPPKHDRADWQPTHLELRLLAHEALSGGHVSADGNAAQGMAQLGSLLASYARLMLHPGRDGCPADLRATWAALHPEAEAARGAAGAASLLLALTQSGISGVRAGFLQPEGGSALAGSGRGSDRSGDASGDAVQGAGSDESWRRLLAAHSTSRSFWHTALGSLYAAGRLVGHVLAVGWQTVARAVGLTGMTEDAAAARADSESTAQFAARTGGEEVEEIARPASKLLPIAGAGDFTPLLAARDASIARQALLTAVLAGTSGGGGGAAAGDALYEWALMILAGAGASDSAHTGNRAPDSAEWSAPGSVHGGARGGVQPGGAAAAGLWSPVDDAVAGGFMHLAALAGSPAAALYLAHHYQHGAPAGLQGSAAQAHAMGLSGATRAPATRGTDAAAASGLRQAWACGHQSTAVDFHEHGGQTTSYADLAPSGSCTAPALQAAAERVRRHYSERDTGFPRDTDLAAHYYDAAADQAEVDFNARGQQPQHQQDALTSETADSGAVEDAQRGEDDGAVGVLRARCEQGMTGSLRGPDPDACTQYGGLLYWGARGVQRDHAAARDAWRAAADAGHADAACSLASMYARGEGGAANHSEAVKYWTAAADAANHTAALNGLGFAFFNGQDGVPQNASAAFRYFLRAAQQTVQALQAREAGLLSAIAPSGDSLFNLAYMFSHGVGTAANASAAAGLYEAAARQLHHFGSILEMGRQHLRGSLPVIRVTAARAIADAFAALDRRTGGIHGALKGSVASSGRGELQTDAASTRTGAEEAPPSQSAAEPAANPSAELAAVPASKLLSEPATESAASQLSVGSSTDLHGGAVEQAKTSAGACGEAADSAADCSPQGIPPPIDAYHTATAEPQSVELSDIQHDGPTGSPAQLEPASSRVDLLQASGLAADSLAEVHPSADTADPVSGVSSADESLRDPAGTEGELIPPAADAAPKGAAAADRPTLPVVEPAPIRSPDFDARTQRRDASAALDYLTPAAQQGRPGGLLRAGFERYLVGDYDGSLLRYLQAHLLGLGSPLAAANAGYLLRRRLVDWRALGMQAQCPESRTSAQGSGLTATRIDASLGEQRLDSPLPLLSRRLLQVAAAGGNSDSMLLLAEQLEHGWGGPADVPAAEALYRKIVTDYAAGAAASQAAYRLGALYHARAARAAQHERDGELSAGFLRAGTAAGAPEQRARLEASLLQLSARYYAQSISVALDDAHRLPAITQLTRLRLCIKQRTWAAHVPSWLLSFLWAPIADLCIP
jgi:TPR repeat protein